MTSIIHDDKNSEIWTQEENFLNIQYTVYTFKCPIKIQGVLTLESSFTIRNYFCTVQNKPKSIIYVSKTN